MISALILGLALTLIIIGMPVAFAIGIAGTAYFLLPGTFLPDSTAVQRIVAASQSFPLLAVPLFILLGNLMNSSGITPRLVGLATVIAGWMRGGLAQSTLILSALMGGVSGSAVADAAMQARILGEPMVEKGYDRGFTAALLAIGGLITATLPPSLGLILYGYLGEVSIGRLFIAGIVPGMLLLMVLMIATWGVARQRGYKPETERLPTLREVGHELWRSFWAVLFPIWLLIGIRFGFFTPSEAGAFAVAYALIVGTLIYRELTPAKILDAMVQSLRDIGMIMLIILFSGTFGYVITFERVPQSIAVGPDRAALRDRGVLDGARHAGRGDGAGDAADADPRAGGDGGRDRPGAFRPRDDDAGNLRRHDPAGGRVDVHRLRHPALQLPRLLDPDAAACRGGAGDGHADDPVPRPRDVPSQLADVIR